MSRYTPPTVDNLVRNLPDELKGSRQFLNWTPTRDGKKIPLARDGTWGNAGDPGCWKSFEAAVDAVGSGEAFGLGMVLVPPERAISSWVPPGDRAGGDRCRCEALHTGITFRIPEKIVEPVRALRTYTEFSTSTMGLRALAFGTIPTTQQHITKTFADGTELGLYHGGWVTCQVCTRACPLPPSNIAKTPST